MTNPNTFKSYTVNLCTLSRERDTTGQLIGDIDQVISVVTDLVQGTITWADACETLPAYDGVQAVD